MAKIINKGRSRTGIANVRLEPNEVGDVDMKPAEVRKHPFYLSGRIDLVEGAAKGGAKGQQAKGGAKDSETGESASGETWPQDDQTGESQS